MSRHDRAGQTTEPVRWKRATPRFLVLAPNPFGVGGIERVTRTLIESMAERFGADCVGLLSLRGGKGSLPAQIFHRGRRRPEDQRVPLFDKMAFVASALLSARRWRRRLVIVATHPHLAPVALAAGRLSGAPVAVWCHGHEVWRPLRPTVRTALRRAALVFAPSRFTSQQATYWAGLNREPLVVPHAVPHAFAASGHLRGEPVPGQVLAVARLDPQDRGKGIDTLLRAWPKVAATRPQARLVVVGDGADRERLEDAARRSGSNGVWFAGRLGDPDLRELYRSSTVFALPTRARVGVDAYGEGFGLVFVEAAAAGLPVVAGRSGAVPEVVEHGATGLLVDPLDVDAVANAIGRLLDDAQLRARMSRAARARANERYSYEAFGDMIANVIGGLARAYQPNHEATLT